MANFGKRYTKFQLKIQLKKIGTNNLMYPSKLQKDKVINKFLDINRKI